MALDADTLKFLDEVKKGKPRRFAMITKGEKILSLILFKKGTVEKYKKQAKEEGKGQFCHGVVDGKGQSIAFNLCTADGFDTPPGKDVKLKAFLKDEAGMQFKPIYQIVNELPALDSSDDSDQATDQQPDAQESPSPDPVSGGSGDKESAVAAKLIEALNKITPLIKQAVTTLPDKKAALLKPASSIKTAIAEGRYQEAKSELVDYGKMLKQVAATSEGSPEPATPAQDGSLVAFRSARLLWDNARKSVRSELQRLESAIVQTFAALPSLPEDKFAEIAQGSKGLYTVLDALDDRLLDKLDDAINAESPDTRNGHLKQAKGILKEYAQFVTSDDMIQAIDKNPFANTSVRSRLVSTIKELNKQLA